MTRSIKRFWRILTRAPQKDPEMFEHEGIWYSYRWFVLEDGQLKFTTGDKRVVKDVNILNPKYRDKTIKQLLEEREN